MEVSTILRQLMQKHYLTISQLSEKSSVSTALILRLLSNESDAKVSTIKKLANAFGLTLSQFFAENNMIIFS